MKIQILDIINILTTPTAGLIGWLVGRRKQKNDFLTELQASIDLLVTKNKELLEEILKLREENSKLRSENMEFKDDILKLQKEVEELNRKLEGLGTITRSKS